MLDDVGFFNGVEVWNTQRFKQYVSQHSATPLSPKGTSGCGCDVSPWTGNGFAGYGRPSLDQAPWIDSAEPASYDFLGIAAELVTGAGDSMQEREVTPNGNGGSIGAARFIPREITVDALLAATSEAGLSYGKAWLAQLGADSCGGSCSGGKLCMLAYCPSVCSEITTDATPCFEAAHRDILNMYMTTGPKEKKKFAINSSGGVAAQVEIIFTAGDARIWRRPVVVTPGSFFVADPGFVEPICPPIITGCTTDPMCPEPTTTALIPSGIVECWTPLTTPWSVKAHLPSSTLPKRLEAAPTVTVGGGNSGVRSVTVRFYADPANVGCDGLSGCTVCGEINISYVPPDSKLVINAQDKTILLYCLGDTVKPAGDLVSGPGRGVFLWPSLQCAPGLCVTAVGQGPFDGAYLAVDVSAWELMA